MIDSIVIVKWSQGYVAHCRFKDSSLNVDISENNTYSIETSVCRYIRYHIGEYA